MTKNLVYFYMSGKPLMQASGEELLLTIAPLVLGLLFGMLTFALSDSVGLSMAIGTTLGVLIFAIFWSRIVDLGFELKDPKF